MTEPKTLFADAVLVAAARGVEAAMSAYFNAEGDARIYAWHDLSRARMRLSHTLEDRGTGIECACGGCAELRAEVATGA